MTDERHDHHGSQDAITHSADEAIEDLDAPVEAQGDVTGGGVGKADFTFVKRFDKASPALSLGDGSPSTPPPTGP